MTPLVPSDLFRLALPGAPQLAADGRVFYALATHDEPSDETRTAIWLARPGAAPERFTSGTHDRLPRLSPGGDRLAFLADRGDGVRIWVVATAGGEAAAIGEAREGLAGLAWSPDGTTLAFVATAPHDAATAVIMHDERSGARHIRALPFKSDDAGLLDGRRAHLYTIPAAGGAATRVTHGDFDVAAPAWSPDGASIAFVARIGLPEAGFTGDLHVVALAEGTVRTLTAGEGDVNAPAWSPDGARIAYLGHRKGDDAGDRFNTELLLVAATGGEPVALSAGLDRSVIDHIGCDVRAIGGSQPPAWTPDGRELVTLLANEGTSGVAAFAADGSGVRRLVTGERDVFAYALAPDGTLAFTFSTPTVPAEIAVRDAAGGERTVTASNPWLAERSVRAPRRVRPPAADGTPLDLWLLDPDGEGPAPWVLEVHGGPHTAYGYAFSLEFQLLRAHGIGVAYGNPRGSQSYGEAYANAILGDWGGIDADDVLALLDGTLANANVDAARVGLAGGSYGGFMTTWLLGHSSRFAAGVSMRAVNDLVSETGATDLGWFIEAETASPWAADAGRKLFERSPMRSAHRIEAPLLVEHSERDYRCAIDQGEQLFTLLRRLGRTQTEFVRFTGDGHNLSRGGKPRNRVLRLRSIAHWFVRHLQPAGVAPPGDEAGALFAPLATEAR